MEEDEPVRDKEGFGQTVEGEDQIWKVGTSGPRVARLVRLGTRSD